MKEREETFIKDLSLLRCYAVFTDIGIALISSFIVSPTTPSIEGLDCLTRNIKRRRSFETSIIICHSTRHESLLTQLSESPTWQKFDASYGRSTNSVMED